MTRMRRIALFWILLSSGISIGWGFSIGQHANGWVDFRAVYYGTRCLLHHHNPYRVSELESVYRAEGGERPTESAATLQAVTLFVNLPTTFIFVAPFAVLPWGPAHLLWITLTAGFFLLSAFLIWEAAASYAPKITLILLCIVLVNGEGIFCSGNTAGIVIGLCVVAVWCFLKDRFVWAGVLSMAIGMAIKPHDAGLVWLFFLLAGGVYRKRALQSLLITALAGIAAFLWISQIAPHWMQDWQANLATISAPGGINEPGPASVTSRTADMVIDLQAAISIFYDDPRIYNPVSYLFCGALLLAWSARTLTARCTRQRAWLALAAVSAITLLVTYHRPWDAKLLLLAIPACAMLWSEGGRGRWIAAAITSTGLLMTGDIPLAISGILFNRLHSGATGFFAELLTLALIRPASLVLLAMAIYYSWTYLKRKEFDSAATLAKAISG